MLLYICGLGNSKAVSALLTREHLKTFGLATVRLCDLVEMANDLLRDNPELRPFVLSSAQITGTRIGAGAYGSVEEVMISGAVCAAKKIHDVFQDRSAIPEAEIRKASAQFVRECQLMSTLRHPHIVQFLGVCSLPGSRLPALVMERLLTSLHDLLDPERHHPPSLDAPKPFIPLSLKCSILHNVASGLAYLHDRSPPVIHRDLSARNVLLSSGMVAKIADLGVARILPHLRAAATMTQAPGAGIYMPPEALETKPEEEEQRSKYDASIDVFSFGVVSIFTLSQTFPCNLLAPTYREGHRHIARTELERRNQYVQMIHSQSHKNHFLLQMIKRCLDFPEDRPDIHEVLLLLEQARMKERDEHTEMNKLELIRALHTQPRNQSLMARKEAELTRAEETIRRQHQQIQDMEQSSRKEIGDLVKKLESSEALVADFQKVLQQRDSELEALRSKVAQGLTLQCRGKKKAPRKMSRGFATNNHEFAYLIPADLHCVYRYKWSTEEWDVLPPCPYHDCALVSIDGALVAVGGENGSHCTNKLLTLQQRQWVEELPPMKHACSKMAAVLTSDGENLVVIGGNVSRSFSGDEHGISTVELFQVRSRKWSLLANLPQPLASPSASICGNYIHVIGHENGFSCSLQHLLTTSQSRSHITSWSSLPLLPVKYSTAATLCGQLIIIGGNRGESNVSSIHQLVYGQWVQIGSMSSARYQCFVFSPSPNKIMIVGGVRVIGMLTDSVEECVVQ